MRKYLISRAKKTLSLINEAVLFGRINVYIKDPFPEEVEFRKILSRVERALPNHLSKNVDSVFVGQFPDLIDRELLSMYADGAVYLSNTYTSNPDIIFEGLLHEIGHSLEEQYSAEIYADQKVLIEFLAKRQVLYTKLIMLNVERPERSLMMEPEYTEELDNYFYKDVGYDNLQLIIDNLFVSPYAATSIREYFAIGFEEYFAGNTELARVSPALYKKLKYLENMY